MSVIDDVVVTVIGGGRIFVAPGMDAPVASSLTPSDGIVLVVLPADVGMSAMEVAKRLDAETGGKYTFAVAVGNEGAGFSTVLSSGVAGTFFDRAMDIANTPQTAMPVFAKLVHSYQATPAGVTDMRISTTARTSTIPQPVAQPSESEPGFTPVAIGGALVLVSVSAVVAWAFSRARRKARRKERKRADAFRERVGNFEVDAGARRSADYTPGDFEVWAGVYTRLASRLRQGGNLEGPALADVMEDIARDVLDMMPAWENIRDTLVADELRDVCFSIIPHNCGIVSRLPSDLRDKKVDGVVPLSLLLKNLQTIATGVSELKTSVFSGSVSDLLVQNMFVDAKFKKTDLLLE